MKIDFSTNSPNENVLVVPMRGGNTHTITDTVLRDFIDKALEGEGFKGGAGQTLTLRGSSAAQKVVLLGLGSEQMTPSAVKKIASSLHRKLQAEGAKKVTFSGDSAHPKVMGWIADGLLLDSYTFSKYKSHAATGIESITFRGKNADEAAEVFAQASKTTESVFFASDLANEPANIMNPQAYEDRIRAEFAGLGNVKVTVLQKADMEKLGMNAALGVGKGSATPPRMIVLEYDGTGGAQERPLALVGKGITFDSGGISLKPGSGMDAMSLDMSGAAAVAGTIRALAATGAPTRVVGIMAMAENMPDANAQRPGDIVKSMSGKTIMVGNTDAEGRLVLADAMTYIQKTYNPYTMIDLATLTGAAVAALGKEFAAVCTNDNRLFEKFNAAANATGEKVWRMPLMETEAFKNAVRNTPLADLTNLAGGPGVMTAAAFLHEFVEKDANGKDKCSWIHVDMAGPGMPDSVRKGWGVQLLDLFIRKFAEVPANENGCRKPPQEQPVCAKPPQPRQARGPKAN